MTRVLYICNAGVLIESGGKKILIDCFAENSRTLYRDISPARLKALLNGSAPFDNIDALCITHLHPDHCNPDTLNAYVNHFPDVPVVCGPETASALRGGSHGAGSVIVADPTMGNAMPIRVDDMTIMAVNTLHEGNRYAGVENLSFILHLEHTIIHPGDAASSETNLLAMSAALHKGEQPDEQPADTVLLAPFPYLTLPAAYIRVRRILNPTHFLTLHLPVPDQDAGGWIAATRSGLRKRGDERTRLLEREGEWVELESSLDDTP